MAANANIKQALLTLDATATTQYQRIIKIQAKVTKGEKRLKKVLGVAKADYQNTLIMAQTERLQSQPPKTPPPTATPPTWSMASADGLTNWRRVPPSGGIKPQPRSEVRGTHKRR